MSRLDELWEKLTPEERAEKLRQVGESLSEEIRGRAWARREARFRTPVDVLPDVEPDADDF